MNLFQYVSAMRELGSTVALIGIVILCLFLVTLISNMFSGMRRGFWKQIVCTITTVISMILSVLIASGLGEMIIGRYDTPAIEDLIVKVEGVVPQIGEFLRKTLLSIEPTIFESIFLLPASLLLIPLVATVCFIVFNSLLKIVRLIVFKVMDLKKATNNLERLGGILLAAVEAIICIIMITLPISGIVSLVSSAYDKASESRYAHKNVELERINEEYLAPFTENPAFTFISAVGGEAISDNIATVTINGSDVNLRDEVVNISSIVLSEVTVLKESDIAGLDKDGKEAIENIIDGVCASPYLTNIVSGALRNGSVILDLGIIEYEESSDLAKIINGLVGYLGTITNETLEEDLTTMKELLFTISDSGALKAVRDGDGEDLWVVLQDQRKSGDDTISKLIDILQRNERTAGLVKTFTEVLIASLATEITTPDGTVITVTYDDLKDSMNDVLNVKQQPGETHDEYMKNLSSTLDETFTEHGIELEKEIVDDIAEYIDTEYKNNKELTDEEFNDVLLHYYDAYLEYLETGNIPEDIPDNIPDFNN